MFNSSSNQIATSARAAIRRRPLAFAASLLLITVTLAFTGSASFAGEPVADYESQVKPILMRRCGHCHGAETQESMLRFDTLSIDIANDRSAAQHWREAVNAINAAEMPPEDEPPLTSSERETVVSWITAAIDEAIAQQRSTGGRTVLRRLTNAEYQNTMQDLLGLDMDYTRDLPPDAVSPEGYTNNAHALRMSALQLEYYLDTARRAMDRVIVTGAPPEVFRHEFSKTNVGGWRGAVEKTNRLERAQKFLVKMVDKYPESGEFRVLVRLRAELKPDKGFPLLECAVGYRPDTEVHFRVAGTREIVAEKLQQVEFRGRLENHPLPVRGQGKYPGLVVRLRNVYDDGTPIPTKLEKIKRDGKDVQAFRPEPDKPAILVESLTFEGPVYTTWPPELHQRILFESPLRDANEVAYVREVLGRFMTRAFRRPATRDEVEDMFSFFASIRPDYIRFEDAIRETLAMVLIQPPFLFHLEPASEKKRSVDDWELASRISYFLYGSMPDARLTELARQQRLRLPDVLESELDRLLDGQAARPFATRFVQQWLQLDHIDNVSIDGKRYPGFNDKLKSTMATETAEHFLTLLKSDESVLKLLDADFMMLNESLARHYGIAEVYGQQFRRVAIDETSKRGGVLTHAGVLLANSTGKDSHPVRRAVWIRDRLLDDPPAPPPPDVPPLDEADPKFAELSVREQLEIHRDRESCASCHRDLDPWGIALEGFDAIGKWKGESERADDSAGSQPLPDLSHNLLPNGAVLNGPKALREHLAKERHAEFARAIVKNLLNFALARSLELGDEPTIDALTQQFADNNYRLKPLLFAIVKSEPFQTR